MSLADREYMQASEKPTRKAGGGFSGFRWEVEECPDCPDDNLKTSLFGGAVGYGVGMLLGMTPAGRFLAAAAGAIGASFANRYHFNLDWDPDRYRGDDEHGDKDRRDPEPRRRPKPL